MKRKSIFLLLAVLLISFSCSKDDDNAGDGDNNNNNTGEFSETCNPTSAPSGLTVKIDGDTPMEFDTNMTALMDYLTCTEGCTNTDPEAYMECLMSCSNSAGLVPAGGAFSLTLYLTNTTTSSITYIVEPGDWFEPGSGDYQPMLSPAKITEIIPAGETVTITIPVYCLASSKSAPDGESEYTLCEVISQSGCLADIVDILKTKDAEEFTFTQTSEIQDIIWKCTEGEEVDLDVLRALPDL